MDLSTRFITHTTFGRIHPKLKRMVDEGLVAFEVEKQEGKPDKKMYAIADLARLCA